MNSGCGAFESHVCIKNNVPQCLSLKKLPSEMLLNAAQLSNCCNFRIMRNTLNSRNIEYIYIYTGENELYYKFISL